MALRSITTALGVALAFPVFAANVNLVDGDTIKIGRETIRIVEIDTPETYKPRCERELVLGLAAKQRLRQLLDSGAVTFAPTGADRYGRTLASVFADGVNIGETMVSEGFALRYRPGARAKLERLRVWCGPQAQLEDRF